MPQSESSPNVHGFCSNLYSMSWTCAIEATLLYFVMGFVSVFYPLWRYSPVNEQLDRLPARHGMDLRPAKHRAGRRRLGEKLEAPTITINPVLGGDQWIMNPWDYYYCYCYYLFFFSGIFVFIIINNDNNYHIILYYIIIIIMNIYFYFPTCSFLIVSSLLFSLVLFLVFCYLFKLNIFNSNL
jgi:hypothetical protein